MKTLVVKMSSLGDVVHTLPAVSEAIERGADITWVVEEAFAPIVERHSGVQRVLPIAWRRWRSNLVKHIGPLRRFVSDLRATQYDLVIDAQGLYKSGVVTSLAKAPRKVGLDRDSAREPGANRFYTEAFAVPRGQHAIDRTRALFGHTFGYQPKGEHDFGFDELGDVAGDDYCVLLHGTTWDSKHYPESLWQGLVAQAEAYGLQVLLPRGSEAEQQRAARIAAHSNARVLPATGLQELMTILQGAKVCIGVDSGLSHLAAAFNVPTLVLFGSTDSVLTGARGRRTKNLQSDFACSPCMNQACEYTGEPTLWQQTEITPACYARLNPEMVWQQAKDILSADRILSL